MLIPLEGTSPEALGELLGATSRPSIRALAVWQAAVLAANPGAELEYLCFDTDQRLRVIMDESLSWEAVRPRGQSRLEFVCVVGDTRGAPVVPGIPSDPSAVHNPELLRRELDDALSSARASAGVAQ